MTTEPSSARLNASEDAWARVAAAAGRLFLTRGYSGVSLKEIGESLNMKPASLYYHCPAGKAELYFRSLTFVLDEYRGALDSIASEHEYPRAVLAMSSLMLEHPPVDFRRIMDVDVPALARVDRALANQVPELLHNTVLEPFRGLLADARSEGLLEKDVNIDVAAAAVVSLIESLGIRHGPQTDGGVDVAIEEMVSGALELLLRGMAPYGSRQT